MTSSTALFFGVAVVVSFLVGPTESVRTTTPRGARSTSSYHHHSVLRGLKKDDSKEDKIPKTSKSPKEKASSPDPPPGGGGGGGGGDTRQQKTPPGGGGKKKHLYQEYSYFVEACQEELVADVINGGIIQHHQFTDFVYGYCLESDNEGKACTKQQEALGFDQLPNEIKLLYIKSFCPTDVEGQVECLHGINDRGRTYEVHEEVEALCGDLERSMVHTGLLELPGTNSYMNDFTC